MLGIGKKKPDRKKVFNFTIKNLGTRECYIRCSEDCVIKSNIKFDIYSPSIDEYDDNKTISEKILLKKGYNNIIPRNNGDITIIQIQIFFNKKEINEILKEKSNVYLEIIINFMYEDVFEFYEYDANTKISFAFFPNKKSNDHNLRFLSIATYNLRTRKIT